MVRPRATPDRRRGCNPIVRLIPSRSRPATSDEARPADAARCPAADAADLHDCVGRQHSDFRHSRYPSMSMARHGEIVRVVEVLAAVVDAERDAVLFRRCDVDLGVPVAEVPERRAGRRNETRGQGAAADRANRSRTAVPPVGANRSRTLS